MHDKNAHRGIFSMAMNANIYERKERASVAV